MAKLALIFIFAFSLNASVYESNCIPCHKNQPVKLDKLFYRYILKYSSKEDVTKALKEYLKNPSFYKSVMPRGYINRLGIKLPTKLNEKELDEAIEEYWQRYKLKGRIKLKR
jgi:hypothetical protein